MASSEVGFEPQIGFAQGTGGVDDLQAHPSFVVHPRHRGHRNHWARSTWRSRLVMGLAAIARFRWQAEQVY
ncbi:hypothetical protein [Nonomuraea fuscirosea]|uniref:hypothetical protein n=1 Tax=Nonomuraea fuscirosea TaxID=1291556 RepID=UPI0034489F39